jgi:CheY-like chemotaxis protein
MLLPLGFRIREAASGRECLESVLEHRPDAVLLDIAMDDMDGWETARRIRAHGLDDLPIIMVSADAFENQSDKIAAAGCQGFVDKPVIESELLAVLQRHLELEWVAELAVSSWAPASPLPSGSTVALPREHAEALLRLARLGHAQGLQRALDALAAEHADCEPQVVALRGLAARFAWDDLIARLSADLQLTDGETTA